MDCELEQPEVGPSTLHCSSTASPEIMALAQCWLARCLEKDKDTCPTSSEFLPSRLVQITTAGGMVQSARLVLQDELPRPTQYLTLSHCWGKVQVAVLLRSTYQAFRSDIPLSILSKTFRDALQVTASLGYKYIWIDSLCIQQDSDWDWAKEAATMGDVYRQSTCTLAATGAEDGSGGLFFERSALAITPCPLFRRQDEMPLYASPRRSWPEPLNKRAWAVQERYLSPRTLSFGTDKVSWTCRYGECCEGPNAHHMKLGHNAFSKLLDDRVDENSASDAWEAIVQSYSSCKVTFWKDRWPAFQGLASQVSTAQDWQIVHGLRHHLLGSTELLWKVTSRGPGTIDCREPSWSWLNIKGGIELFWAAFKHCDADVTVEDSSTSSTSTDGPTTILRVTACMAEFKSGFVGSELHVSCSLTVSNSSYHSESSDRFSHGLWCPDTLPVCEGPLWAIQILGGHESYKASGTYDSFGIVVVAVEGRPGFWRRVGWYTNTSNYNFDEGKACPFGRKKSTIFLI
ncbi:heterokaryon incompatibility protein-domain-containing protein [Boeremia exigua]|uniref:heterokaryon incompatibility protein-domain-containing protein n=1 Tax=Boeremia exigua TaxID=749465 RepID=UPI001E8E06F5|nr:heterokaryon incompatibility protein-domain-containing protein [Boeremia exigua]KAH6620585.1 heterokaryon incompatibility protein-domain-containing protein [Boeremia exigua]